MISSKRWILSCERPKLIPDKPGGKNVNRKVAVTAYILCSVLLTGLVLINGSALAAEESGKPEKAGQSAGGTSDAGVDCDPVTQGSPYIPVDSWVYPAVLRLYAMGYVDTVYLGMRPWTRASLNHMLEETADRIEDAEGAPGENDAEIGRASCRER